ncbi:hypothetical protein DPMN_024259 [Dreissena polymorpha]|uniref:Uncharacterized protein n=1 Tax=Dreissena polymorpha TaxID=45954 RepID=A0A9D4RC54_DREPO|nr:hypothetical protein DPMN_024259 [Dreissena polymorpha]
MASWVIKLRELRERQEEVQEEFALEIADVIGPEMRVGRKSPRLVWPYFGNSTLIQNQKYKLWIKNLQEC